MGGRNSCLTSQPHYDKQCVENHSSTPKIKSSKRNLSAAFNLVDIANEPIAEQLNINTATEEQLMTLPLVNRATAHKIVEYRNQIGGFKKVEDLALVSGFGANNFNLVRLEICVGRKRSSLSSSRTSSKGDLNSESSATSRVTYTRQNRTNCNGFGPKTSVNKANIFQLMKVRGISQKLAENIVSYREKKGPFSRLEDLVKVKGFSAGLLSAIRHQLCLYGDTLSTTGLSSSFHGHGSNGAPPSHITRAASLNQWDPNKTPPSRESLLGGSQDDLLSLYGPLARRSMRAKIRPPSRVIEQRKVIRFATWNLGDCTKSKAENPGVKEVFSMTVLENGIDIIAVQELRDPDALSHICDELNAPVTPNVKKWTGERGIWNYVVTDSSINLDPKNEEYLGFIYNTASGIELVSTTAVSLLRSSLTDLQTLPLCALFKIDNIYLVLVNVHAHNLDETSNPGSALQKLSFLQQFSDSSRVNPIVILGDFGEETSDEVLSTVHDLGFKSLLNSESDCETPGVSGMQHHICFNNKTEESFYTGASGLVTEGLTSPWIPNGWDWGGPISSHKPMWAELYANELSSNS